MKSIYFSYFDFRHWSLWLEKGEPYKYTTPKIVSDIYPVHKNVMDSIWDAFIQVEWNKQRG